MWRLTSVTIVACLGLGTFGNALDSHWQAGDYTASADFASVVAVPAIPASTTGGEVRREAVQVRTPAQDLDGMVFSPAAAGRHPAVVVVHGAGTSTWEGFDRQAEHFARSGIVVLVFDKRTAGYSPWHRDYVAMADDTLAGVELLRTRADVDPDSIGLFAESEGAWIAPVAAAKDPRISFVVLISAPVVSPAQQAAYATRMALDGIEAPAPAHRAVAKGISMAMSVPNLLDYAEFDVLPWLERLDQPMLFVYGTADTAVPLIQAPELAIDSAAAHGNTDVAVRYFDGAQHGIKIDEDFAPEYLDTVSAWMSAAAARQSLPGPRVAGGQPVQTLSAGEVQPTRWFDTAPVHAAVLCLALAGYLAGPAASGVARLRWGSQAHRLSPARRRRLRWLRTLGTATLLLLVAFFVGLSHLALNGQTNPVLTYGAWAAVWAAAAGTVMVLASLRVDGGAALAVLERADDVDGARMNGVEVVASVGAVMGTILLMFVVTYWGVFIGI
ncbi:MAG: alpha/beta hydrolase family protein [Jiangellaceae bacterium]